MSAGRHRGRVKYLRVHRVGNQVDSIGIDVEHFLALLHVEFRDGRDRVGATNGPFSESRVVEFLLYPKLGPGPLVEFGLPDVGGTMDVKDERDPGETGGKRGLVGREKDVGVCMDDIDGISDQAREDVRHRVDAKREPIASACLDRYVRAHLVPAVRVGVPGGKEVHGVSAFLELQGEVRRVDDGAAGPGR